MKNFISLPSGGKTEYVCIDHIERIYILREGMTTIGFVSGKDVNYECTPDHVLSLLSAATRNDCR